jgi:hypothetical protein
MTILSMLFERIFNAPLPDAAAKIKEYKDIILYHR